MHNLKNNIISNFLVYIKKIRNYSIHTYRSYEYDIKDYAKFCNEFDPEHELNKLDQAAIRSYLQYLSKINLSSKTIARRLATIKSFYKLPPICNKYLSIFPVN